MNTQSQIVTDNSPTPAGYKDFYVMHGELMDEQQLADYYAQKEQEAITTPIEPVAPVEDSSLIEQVGVGAVQTLGGIPMAAEALTHSDFLHNINNSIEEWTKEHSPEEFNLKDAIASGLGSSAPLYLAGVGIVPVAMAMGIAAPVALALGIPTLVVLESMVEGGHRYRKSLKEHGDENKASAEAALTFAGNIPLNALTETLLGPLGRIKGTGLKGAAKTVGKAAAGGVIEEPAQLLISEGAAGHLPSTSELGTEALVGGIVSGIIGTGFSAVDLYKGKKSDFTSTDLDDTRTEHKEETSTETPLISMDTVEQVLAKAEAEFVKTSVPPTEPPAGPPSKYAPEPEGAMPQEGPIIPSGAPLPMAEQGIIDLTEEVKAGIRINLLGGNEAAIEQMRQARLADAEGANRLYRDAINRAIRDGKVKELASIDNAVADALEVSPMLETEIGTRLKESPINKKIAELESTPIESRTPELQKRIDDNKVLLDNTTIAKQLGDVKKAKQLKIAKQVSSLQDKVGRIIQENKKKITNYFYLGDSVDKQRVSMEQLDVEDSDTYKALTDIIEQDPIQSISTIIIDNIGKDTQKAVAQIQKVGDLLSISDSDMATLTSFIISTNKEQISRMTDISKLQQWIDSTIAKEKTTTTITRKKKSLFKEVRIEGDKLVSKETPVIPVEGVVPTKRGKRKESVQVDVLSSEYIEGLKEDLNISELRKTQQLLEDTADNLEGELIDHKKGTPEYDTINNKRIMYMNLADGISKFRGERAGKNDVLLDSLGFQKAYELLSNPDILIADIRENLRTIGTAVYDASMRLSDFVVAMKGKLGDLYERFKPHLITLFDIIKNQRGSWSSIERADRITREGVKGLAFQDYGDDQVKIWIQDENVTINPNVMVNYNGILSFVDPDAPGRPTIDTGQLITLNNTFIAYPELMNIQVTTAAFSDPMIGGGLNPNTGTIYINENVTDPIEIQRIILHELQHAIQYIQGWSLGTSTEEIKAMMVLRLGESESKKTNIDKISNETYWNTIGEMLARDAEIRQMNIAFKEGLGISPYTLDVTDPVNVENITDIQDGEIVSVYSLMEERRQIITKDTNSTVAAERLIKFDTMPLASNDVRKGLIPAQRYEDGTIESGESQMKIGFHSDRDVTELGWVTPEGDFVPGSMLAQHEVPNVQNKLFGKEKIDMLGLMLSAQKVVDPTGQASTETFNEEKMNLQDKVRRNLIRFEKAANTKGMALDNYLRDIGFSESAVNELMNLRNALPKGSSYTEYITKSQVELLRRLEQEKGLDIGSVKAEIGIKDIEGKKMRRIDANKLINYIQVNKGIKLDTIIDTEVLLNNIENDVISADTMTELKRTKAFLMQMFLSPDIVLSSTPTGKQIYNVLDKAVILINKGKERIFGKTGYNIDAYDELIKVESITSERIAAVLDGKADYKLLSKEEQVVVDKMRAAFKYMLNEFVDKKSADVNETTLVRQLAPSVKYDVGETASVIKKRLHDLQTEYNISKGGMEALDLLRMERENYLPHIFDSQEIIKTAIHKLEKLIQVDPLSPKVAQLRNTIARLSGGDFVMQSEIPNELYFAHLEERTDVEGYKLDAGLAFHTYVRGWLRKMYLEPAVNVAKDLYIQLPATQKPYAKWFILEVAGRNKRTPGASYVSMAEWIRLIGFNMGSALTNATGVLNTFADSGTHGIDGMQRALTVQGRQEFYREGLGYETRFKASPVEELHGKLEKLRKWSGILFDQVELGNRMHAFHTGKSKGESIGLKGDELTSYAIDFMHKVQFRYGITGMAKGMRGWPGVATQFSSFTVKQWELILGKWRREPEGLKKIVAYLMLSAGANTMLRFIGMDISNAAGIPLSYGDLLESVTSATEGDWEKATKHWKLSAQGGTGILPREVVMTGPAVNLLMQIKDTHSPDWLGRIGNELSPPLANKAIDLYYGLKHGNAKDDEFPIYAYDSRDPLKKAMEGPRDLKYTLSLYSLILRTFGPRPSEETEIQRKEFARLLTSQEITSILSKYDKALMSGNTDKMTELFNLYPGVIYDRGTGALKRRAMDLQLTREQRSLFKRKSAQRAASLDAE